MHTQLLSEVLSLEGVLQVALTDEEGLLRENIGEGNETDGIIADIFAITETFVSKIERLTIEAEHGFIIAELCADGSLIIAILTTEANLGKVRSLLSNVKSRLESLE